MEHRPTRIDPRLSRTISSLEHNQNVAQPLADAQLVKAADHHQQQQQEQPSAHPMQIPRRRLQRPSSTSDEHPPLDQREEHSTQPQSFYIPPPPSSSQQPLQQPTLISRIPSHDSDATASNSNTNSGAAASSSSVPAPARSIRSRSSSASSTHELSPSQQAEADHRARNSHALSQPAHRSKLSKQYTPSDSEESSEGEDEDDDKSDGSDDEPVLITQARRSRFLSGQPFALNKSLGGQRVTSHVEDEHALQQPHQYEQHTLVQTQPIQQLPHQKQAQLAQLVDDEHSRLGTPSSIKSGKPKLSLKKRISKLFGRKPSPSSSASSISSDSSNTKSASLMSASASTLSLSSTIQQIASGGSAQSIHPPVTTNGSRKSSISLSQTLTSPSSSWVNKEADTIKKTTNRMSAMSLDSTAPPPPPHQMHRMSMLSLHQRAVSSPETSTPTLFQQMQQRQQLQQQQSPMQFHTGYQTSPKLLPVTGVSKTRDSGFAELDEAVQHRRHRSSSNDTSGTISASHRLSMALPPMMNIDAPGKRHSVAMLDDPSRWQQQQQQQQRSNSMSSSENEVKRMSVFGGQELVAPLQSAEHQLPAERRSSTPTPGPKPLISRLDRQNHSVCFQEASVKPKEASTQAIDPKISQLAQQHRKDFKRMQQHHHQQAQQLQQLPHPQETMEVLQPSPVVGVPGEFLMIAENARTGAGHRRESTSSQYYYVPQHLQFHQAGTPVRRSSGDSLTQVSMNGVPLPTHTMVQAAAGQPAMVVPIIPTKNPHRASISSLNQQQNNGMALTALPTPLSTPTPMRQGSVSTPGGLNVGSTTAGYFGLPVHGTSLQMSPFSSPSLGAVSTSNSTTDLSLTNDLAQQQLNQIRLQQQQLLLQQQQQQLQQKLHETTQALALSRAAAQSALLANATQDAAITESGDTAAVSAADDRLLLQHQQLLQQQQPTSAAMFYSAPLLTPMLNMGIAANGMSVLPGGGAIYAAAPSALSPPLLGSPQMPTLVGYQAM